MSGMSMDELERLLDTHGADPARWPAAMRTAALSLTGENAVARAHLEAAQRLDARLSVAGPPASAELRARILALPDRAEAPAHARTVVRAPTLRARDARWTQGGGARTWWPIGSGLAAMAASLLLGFYVGTVDLDAAVLDEVDITALALGLHSEDLQP